MPPDEDDTAVIGSESSFSALSTKTAAAAVIGASTAAAASWGTYHFLAAQARIARLRIGKLPPYPPEADGVYSPTGGRPERWGSQKSADFHLMIFGDSTAAGLGCTFADETPGVRLARGLAEESGKRVRLSTKAISGATSKGLSGQVDASFVAGSPPDVAVILIGANDVTARQSIRAAARRLRDAVRRLHSAGSVVIVGTCPDLGIVTDVPQPLRAVIRRWGLRLARAQAAVTRAEGGHPVPLADLLTPEFLASPDRMFSTDRFHPSPAGYELAARNILPVMCTALGIWHGGPLEELPEVSAAVEARRPTVRAWNALNRAWFRHRQPRAAPGPREIDNRGRRNPFGVAPAAHLRRVARQHRHGKRSPLPD
ncbi:SGNH/GDSL hydrolase family protein [Hoyosella sp. G463]|uniref:SGNH/GDSL hydrolase family protein n=1 Tax=Lolliginicoccus lacisalsi TaxID=2742202 RepID=A0A927JBM7_9ACTN|nr:SGNH/GDSL hydrolase family protein [Lolliginicoccus lacisalsi]MBD8506185.1 SGNH/GDSL hydrolase family protein [Lolliginicoccus lacisalsi]